jgi:hypothetical protein
LIHTQRLAPAIETFGMLGIHKMVCVQGIGSPRPTALLHMALSFCR